MFTRLLIAMLIMLLSDSFAAADVLYEWIDEKGAVSLRDTPPPATKAQKKKIYKHSTLIEISPSNSKPGPSKGAAALAPQPVPQRQPFPGTVELYVTSWCGYCKKAQDYLKGKQVPYSVYDIEKDNAAKQRHRELGGNGVPLIIIGPHKISGFSAALIDKYLSE